MEEVPGIPGVVPLLAPYRQPDNLPPEEWQACLDAWLLSIDMRLRLQEHHFCQFSFLQNASGVPFLVSYFAHQRTDKPPSRVLPKELTLLKHSYLLTKRLLLCIPMSNMLKPLEMVDFILGATTAYHEFSEYRAMLDQYVAESQIQSGMAAWKSRLSTNASDGTLSTALEDLKRMNLLLRVWPQAGVELMKGADYIESLTSAYLSADDTFKTTLTEHIYRCFLGLLKSNTMSTFTDQVYLLKSESEKTPQQKTLCTSLICETGFLRALSSNPSVNDSQGGRRVIEYLALYRENTKHLHPPTASRHTRSKGKGKATRDNMHVHKATQISQIHDLFPEVATGYIIRLLDYFNDDTEQAIAALLEPDSLPPLLQDQNSEQAISEAIDELPDLAPRSTTPLLPQRKNVFDNDEFDKLRISSKQIHRGRKELNISEPTTHEEHNKSKAAIMAALAAFDSDDDERDDTYDVADVGGSVDQSVDTDTRPSTVKNAHDETLFRAWANDPTLFFRDSKTRVSKIRQQLKRETGMTDEQIEGWAIVLGRDQAMQNRLQKRYSTTATFRGNQLSIGQTKWQQSAATSTENSHDEDGGEDTPDESNNANDRHRMGQAQIRGSRNWGRGGGGNRGSSAAGGAGPSGAPSSQASQNRQEHSKQHGGFRGGRGGRNNRREGRARKMARGFGAMPTEQ